VSTQPTIGRIVHYVSYGSADGRYKSKCRAAVVSETHLEPADPTTTAVFVPTIGLAVLNPTGVFFDRYVRESDEHTGGTWHWPCVITENDEEEGAST
jgi:hypothetical protein